ncbi:Na+/H+ antiporter NhaA [Pilimelia columellifera]|uniref:Na(+)/H(+) antiporter NhaA n=1 Tax=Pilimelia columellifera subsp. columellifera TaxID=706583 RepID=A0ABP6AAS6_9ACTN
MPNSPYRPRKAKDAAGSAGRGPNARREQRRTYRRAADAAAEAAQFLRAEQVGGMVLLAATVLALIAANSPLADLYHQVSDFTFGPEALHLRLSVHQWATDGLLTLFFLIAGLELKRELVTGDLRNPRKALLPIASAFGGMLVPALVFIAVAGTSAGAGWAIPVATDIAFALAVLAIFGRLLPANLRVFLLTLAIVDDLGAIVLIAALFTSGIALAPLFGSLAAVGAWALAQKHRLTGWWIYLPLGLVAWGFMHASGVHATVAGVLLGFATRVRPDRGEQDPPAELFQHRLQPLSAGVAVPVFAFFAAGVTIAGGALSGLASDRLAWGVVAGLVLGKTIGVLGTAFLCVRMGWAHLPTGVKWQELTAVSVLTGCGFTVSLLITELGFDGDQADRLKLAVLAGSVLAAGMSAALLMRSVRARN